MTESQIRQVLRDAATLAPTTLERAEQRRPVRRSFLLPLLTTCACVGLVVAVAVLTSRGGGEPRRVAGPPEGFRSSTFRGVELVVPEAWRDDDTGCGTPKSDTVIHREGGVCLALVPGPMGLSIVEWFGPEGGRFPCTPVGSSEIRRCTARDDEQGRHVIVVQRPATESSAVIRSVDVTLLQRIADSARGVDQVDGCQVRMSSLDSTAPPGTTELVADGPIAMSVCRYTGYVLERTASVTEAQARQYAATLNALPPGLGRPPASDGFPQPGDPRCAEETGRGFRLRFEYEHRDPVWVTLRLTGCGKVVGFDNGERTAYPDFDAISLPTRLTGMDAGWHDLRSNDRS